jgi:choice-of-anchor C domain-containing protein
MAGNLITNGSFEAGPNPVLSPHGFIRLGPGDTSINGWTVTRASIDYVGQLWQASDGGRSIDLDGNDGDAGGMAQTFSTSPNVAYSVTFDMSGNPSNPPTIKSMRVSAAGQSAVFSFDISGHDRYSMGWVKKSWQFTAASSSTTLEFVSLDPTNVAGRGPAIDNVVVTASQPDLAATSLTWDTAQGGVDFGYSVKDAALTQDTIAALYWASGTTEDTILEPATAPIPVPKTIPVDQAQTGHVAQRDIQSRPSGAQDLLLVVNPSGPNHVQESDESNDQNNVAPLKVHSPSEVLDGAVVPNVQGGVEMVASFVPGRNSPDGPFTLSEAEVVLGVDHFNWVQTMQAPSNMQFQIWQGVTDFIPKDQPLQGKPKNGVLVSTPSRAYDPVPNVGGDRMYVIRADGNRLGDVQYVPIFYPDADASELYKQESPPLWKVLTQAGGPESDHEYLFRDRPSLPADIFLTANSFMTFRTRLVGVTSSADWHAFNQPRTGFIWKFNSVHNPTVSLSGYLEGRPVSAPPILAGGIFDVRYDDGTPVPGTPTNPPPIPAPIVPQSLTVAGGKRRRRAAENITIGFSGPVTLGAGAFELVNRRGRKTRPIGLAITNSLVGGRNVAVLHFPGRRRALADGKYTLTIRADKILDNLGRPLDGDSNGVPGGDLIKTLRIARGRSK